jgi:hypothetical protein
MLDQQVDQGPDLGGYVGARRPDDKAAPHHHGKVGQQRHEPSSLDTIDGQEAGQRGNPQARLGRLEQPLAVVRAKAARRKDRYLAASDLKLPSRPFRPSGQDQALML